MEGVFEANKRFKAGGKQYAPGDRFDTKGMPDHKIGQLLNQRFIRPAAEQPTTTKTS